MKLSDVKAQIDTYFDNLNSNDLIKRFELLGYEFEPINDEFGHFIDNFPNSPLI
jgi:hypothetical protein